MLSISGQPVDPYAGVTWALAVITEPATFLLLNRAAVRTVASYAENPFLIIHDDETSVEEGTICVRENDSGAIQTD